MASLHALPTTIRSLLFRFLSASVKKMKAATHAVSLWDQPLCHSCLRIPSLRPSRSHIRVHVGFFVFCRLPLSNSTSLSHWGQFYPSEGGPDIRPTCKRVFYQGWIKLFTEAGCGDFFSHSRSDTIDTIGSRAWEQMGMGLGLSASYPGCWEALDLLGLVRNL